MSGEQCLFEAFDELDISHKCLDEDEKYFAQVIGCIEDTLMDENFLKIHEGFMEDHWSVFEDGEENKLEYMEIFKSYEEKIEKYIEDALIRRIPDFNMIEFERQLRKRQNDLDGEIFEILATFTDFLSFKEKFLDYRAMKEGKTVDVTQNLSVIKYDIVN